MVRTLQKVQYYGQRNGAKYLVCHLNNLQALFVDDYGEIIEYLFETAQKRPQTTSNRDDFKFDDGESRSLTIAASGVICREGSCTLLSRVFIAAVCSRWRRCVLLARIAY